MQILQKQHGPLAQEHYHLRFGAQFHPRKVTYSINVAKDLNDLLTK